MTHVPVAWGLLCAATLFGLGLLGLILRRNLLFMLLSTEIMLNAAGLAFVVAGANHGAADGQVMVLFIFAVAAAEVSIGLALLIALHRQLGSLDGDAAERLRG